MKRMFSGESTSFVLYKWVVLISVLQSFLCWFLWDVSNLVITAILFIASFVFLVSNGIQNNKYYISWFVIYLIAFVFTRNNNLVGWIVFLFSVANLYVLFCLPLELKHRLLTFLRKALAVLLLISLVGWILYLIGIPLPHQDVGYGESSSGGFQYYFDNYYFFLVNQISFYRYVIPRFSSVFVEPGYLGCLMSILLLSDHFRLGKGHRINVIFLVALVFSFSLAGYLFTLFGLVLDKLARNKGRVLWLSFIVLIVFGAYQFFRNYNGGNNIVNEAIVLRLEIDEAEGTIAGYNRSSESLEYYFWNRFITSPKLFFGDKEFIERVSDNAEDEVSWQDYIINYGLIAFIFLGLYFFYPILKKTDERYRKFCICILFFAIFSQTVHMTHSLMYVSLFLTSIGEIEYKKKTDYQNGSNRILSTSVSPH